MVSRGNFPPGPALEKNLYTIFFGWRSGGSIARYLDRESDALPLALSLQLYKYVAKYDRAAKVGVAVLFHILFNVQMEALFCK